MHGALLSVHVRQFIAATSTPFNTRACDMGHMVTLVDVQQRLSSGKQNLVGGRIRSIRARASLQLSARRRRHLLRQPSQNYERLRRTSQRGARTRTPSTPARALLALRIADLAAGRDPAARRRLQGPSGAGWSAGSDTPGGTRAEDVAWLVRSPSSAAAARASRAEVEAADKAYTHD
eukprot:3109154-Prymnesium_polylepis.2